MSYFAHQDTRQRSEREPKKVSDPADFWAARQPDDFAKDAWQRIQAYYQYAGSSQHFERINRAYRTTFQVGGPDGRAWKLEQSGKKGEIIRLQSGDYHNLSEHRITIATQQKPAWQPVATNSDFASLAQANTVAGVLDYYWREKRVARRMREALEALQWGGEGFIHGGWDVNAGETVAADPETGEEVKEGDMWFRSAHVYDVARDPHARAYESCTWLAVREPISKWDLAAKFPEKADDILKVSRDQQSQTYSEYAKQDSDEIFIWHVYVKKSPAMPQGRYMQLAADNIWLLDVPLPFRDIPLFRFTEKELEGTPFGMTTMFDCLGKQEAFDKMTAAIITNFIAHAINKIVGVKGSGINYKQLADALGYIEVSSMEQMPQVLNLSEMNPQVIQFRQMLAQEMQQLANLNDVARGVSSENIKSGSHAAIFDAIALRGANALQEAYFDGSADVGTFVLHTLADYAGDSERVARIVGENNRPLLFTFTAKELQGFERVTVEVVNSSLRTAAGKQSVADALLQKGALSDDITARRYLALVKTGELESMTEAPMSHFLRVKRDKEMLAKGIGPVPMIPVIDPLSGAPMMGPDGQPMTQPMPEPGVQYLAILETDPHWLDIPEWLSVLSSPEARENPAVVEAVTGGVRQKLQMWRNMDPDLLALLGGPPPPSMSGGMPPPGGPPSGTPPPQPGGQSGTAKPAGQEPDMPKLPTNPETGEQHDPTAGAPA